MMAPPQTRQIDSEVRRRLARGVQYNMKIVIRGDRNTGKTQLWRRLQGQHYTAAYTPTEQIQIATINWNYKVSSDVIKLDAWDVVDRAPKKKNQAGMTDSGLKISNTQAFDASELNGDDFGDDDTTDMAADARHNEFGIGTVVPVATTPGSPRAVKQGNYSVGALDASVVDVMRGATGCVMMFDMNKKWTWDYVTREVPKFVKSGIQILVVGNFRDLGESGRVVSTNTAQTFCEMAGPNVHYVEASMKNGFGVRAIAAYFSLPFLSLQKKYLDEQVRRNQEETEAALGEMKALSEELTYELYLKQLADRKAAAASKPTTPPPQPAEKAEHKPENQEKPHEEPKEQKSSPSKSQEMPTALDPATLKRLEQEDKQRAKEEAKAAKARQEEEKKKAKLEEKRRKEEARKKEEFNRSHEKELEQKRKKQAEEDAAAAAELKKLAEMQAKNSAQKKDSGAAAGSSLSSVDDFKIADTDGWLSKTLDGAAADDDGWLVTPEGKDSGKPDPFAFGADDDDGWGNGADEEKEPETQSPSKSGKKKGKKGGHKQAFLADTDDL